MSLNKKKMVREIGRRTQIRNRDVQAVIETLIEVWTEELVSGGRIEIENLFVIEVNKIDRGETPDRLRTGGASYSIRRLSLRVSITLKRKLNARGSR